MISISNWPPAWLSDANAWLALLLLIIGLYCILTRKQVIKQVIGLNIMLQGALLTLIDAGRIHGDMQTSQSLVVSALVAEVIALAITLALIVNIYRFHPRGHSDDLTSLKG
ncbi:MAG: NADH-quinone oxidoreductase subunit NuoK [Anaerolineae bacterium]